jgi:ABC-type transporter Mla MlaB component
LDWESEFPIEFMPLDEYTHITLYSDGLVESLLDVAPGRGREFGVEELKGCHYCAPDDPQEFVRQIWRQRCLTVGQPGHADDVSLLVIRTQSPFTPVPLPAPLPEPPPIDAGELREVLGAGVAQVGALHCWDAQRQVFTVSIRDRADMVIAVALFPVLEEALSQPGTRAIAMDLLQVSHIDSTFQGTLHEVYLACAERGLKLTIALADQEQRNNLLRSYLGGVVSCCRNEPCELAGDCRAVMRLVDLSTPAARERFLRAHQLLAGLSTANADQYRDVLAFLRKEV